MIHLSVLDQMGYMPIPTDGKDDWLPRLRSLTRTLSGTHTHNHAYKMQYMYIVIRNTNNVHSLLEGKADNTDDSAPLQ